MSLPTNPQAMSASERLILETLHQQGETLSYQTKVLQGLTNQITRQRRNDEKVSKKQTPSPRVERNKKSSDDYLEKFKDYSAEVFGKAMGDIREYFASQTSNEKPSSNKMSDQPKPVDTKNDKAKDKKSKNTEDRDIIKNILESMIVTNKYQEQLTENLKSLKILSDKTLTSVSLIQDDINIIKTSNDSDNDANTNEKPVAENTNKRTPLNTRTVNKKEREKVIEKKPAVNEEAKKINEPLDIVKFSKVIGLELSSRLIPSFDKLGKTFTDSIEYAVETLSEILDNNQSNSVDVDVDGSRRRGRTRNGPANSGAANPPRPSGTGINVGGVASTAVVAGLVANQVSNSFDRMGELSPGNQYIINESNRQKEEDAKKKPNDKNSDGNKSQINRTSSGKLEKLQQVEPGEIIPYNGIDYKKQPDGTLADKEGKVLSANIQKNVEETYLRFLNKKGQSSVSFEKEMTTKLNELNSSEKPNSTEVSNKEKLNNQKPRPSRGGPEAGQKEEYERLQRAKKLPDQIKEWAVKQYNDPNLRDPEALADPKYSKILDLLEKHQEDIKKNPNYNLNKKELNPENVNPAKPKKVSLNNTEESKPEKVTQRLDAQPMASILKGVEKESAVLAEKTDIAAAPIIVNNNTTVASSGSGSGMSFVSGSPVNTNNAINDFFRYNGRIFA